MTETSIPEVPYKLFLDDFRDPPICLRYMQRRIGKRVIIYGDPDWVVVRNYEQFTGYIQDHGLPLLISFDHDLALEHYELASMDLMLDLMSEGATPEKSGYDCAQWLISYCRERGEKLPFYYVHSMNRVGTDNINHILKRFIQEQMEDNI